VAWPRRQTQTTHSPETIFSLRVMRFLRVPKFMQANVLDPSLSLYVSAGRFAGAKRFCTPPTSLFS
jgi:hypothetical protein